jgi:hypothetical protein
MTNLDSDHSEPDKVAHGVAGILEGELGEKGAKH